MPSAATSISPTANPSTTGSRQYSPPNWGTQPALYSIVVNNSGTSAPVAGSTTTTMFVFDAIRSADHNQSCIPTKKPLQTGYNSSDNAVLQPAIVVLEAVMSDTIAAYSSGMWSGNPSKSVSAFQQMITLMKNRSLITLNTRLQTYQNCLLTNIRCTDNERYYYGAELILTFEQLIISTVSVQTNSARSQTTGDTQQGTVQPTNPDASIAAQYGNSDTTNIPGAGNYSSNANTILP
jgi:hypothetical protein